MWRTARTLLVIAAVLVASAACSREPAHFAVRTVSVRYVQVSGPGSTIVSLVLNNCSSGSNAGYTVRSSETTHAITVVVKGPVWTGDAQADCANIVALTLRGPIGSRTVIDGSQQSSVPVRSE